VEPNPRGSTGYGQKFIDEINGDWGGKCSTTSWRSPPRGANIPYADGSRMTRRRSYGGYMID